MNTIAATFEEKTEPKKSWWETLVDDFRRDWDIFTDHIQAGFEQIEFDKKWQNIYKLEAVKDQFETAFFGINELTAAAFNERLTGMLNPPKEVGETWLSMYGVKMKDFFDYAESLTAADWENLLELRQEKRAEYNLPLFENETINFDT